MKIIAKTFAGLEAVLAEELRALGARAIQPGTRAVSFEGDTALLYRANLHLRSALRLLVPFRTFKTRHENHLYKKLRETDWSELLEVDDCFAVHAVTQSRHLRHSRYLEQKAKDAIVDQFRERRGRRPSVDLKNPTLRIHLHIGADNTCTLSLDSSGDSLHRRGYRQEGGEAPLSEVLAAGMLLLAGWRGERPFLDPMCGSGTLPIEAALIALGRPPHTPERRFGFERWKSFDADLWHKIRSQVPRESPTLSQPIFASDVAPKALAATRQNLRAAGLEHVVRVRRCELSELEAPAPSGLLVCNPPYDQRIGLLDAEGFYRLLGDVLKQRFQGWDAFVLSANRDALKRIGLRPRRRHVLFNGPLECRYLHFELYAGSRKYSPGE